MVMFTKLCDIVLTCVMGYFNTFNTCWTASLTALTTMITAYLKFLGDMVQCLTAYPAIIFTSATTVVALVVACIMVTSIYDR